jgi:hypothetical protein
VQLLKANGGSNIDILARFVQEPLEFSYRIIPNEVLGVHTKEISRFVKPLGMHDGRKVDRRREEY